MIETNVLIKTYREYWVDLHKWYLYVIIIELLVGGNLTFVREKIKELHKSKQFNPAYMVMQIQGDKQNPIPYR